MEFDFEHNSQTRHYLRELAEMDCISRHEIGTILQMTAELYFNLPADYQEFDDFWADVEAQNRAYYMAIRFVVESASQDIVTLAHGISGGESWTSHELEKIYLGMFDINR